MYVRINANKINKITSHRNSSKNYIIQFEASPTCDNSPITMMFPLCRSTKHVLYIHFLFFTKTQ
jgi:hypothetical protein